MTPVTKRFVSGRRARGLASAALVLPAAFTPPATQAQDIQAPTLSIVEAGLLDDQIGRNLSVQALLTGEWESDGFACAQLRFVPAAGTDLSDPGLQPDLMAWSSGQTLQVAAGGEAPVPIQFRLPADRIRVHNTGDHPTNVVVGIWDGACNWLPPDPPGPLATTSVDFCLARDFGGDWYPACSDHVEARQTAPVSDRRRASAEPVQLLARLQAQEQEIHRLRQEVQDLQVRLDLMTDRLLAAERAVAWKSAEAWDRLRTGMSEEQVRRVLGEPSAVEADGPSLILVFAGNVDGAEVRGSVQLAGGRVYAIIKPRF